jgi:hypothetical protein
MEECENPYRKSIIREGEKVKEYQKDLKKEVGGMSHKGKDFLKKLLKKK